MLWLILPGVGEGAEADPFFDAIPLVLTASRLARSPLEAPAPITVIDRELISASGFTEIHDLLRLVPGFLVADWPEGAPVVASHGLGDAFDRRLKVMIDGRTINSPLWGDTKWQDLPVRVDDIERLEVVRGPNGAAYGVNAFQGVVNIITRSPATEDGVTVIARAGKDGFYDHGVRLNGVAGAPVDWRLSASRRSARNFARYQEPDGPLHGGERVTLNVANFNAVGQLSADDEVRLQLGVSEGTSRRGSSDEDYADYPPHDEDERALYLQLGWLRAIDAESSLNLQYYHQEERTRASWVIRQAVGDAALSLPIDRDSAARRDDLELQYDLRLSATTTAMIGAGLRAEAAESRRLFGASRPRHANHGQLFGSVTWQPVAPLKVDLGGTLEYHDDSGRLFSPRLAANYALGEASALRVSTGIAYRAPSLMESSAFETIRQGDTIRRILYRALSPLEAERVRFVDLGYVAQFRALGLSLDARAFREAYSRFIDDNSCRAYPAAYPFETLSAGEQERICSRAEPANFVPFEDGAKAFYFLNSSAFVMNGAELTADWRREGWGRIVVSQAFIDIRARGAASDRDFELSAPRSTTAVLLIKDLFSRWRASLAYYHNDVFHWMNDGDRVPRRDRFDLKLSRSFGPRGADNEFAVTAQSLAGAYPEFHDSKFRQEPRLFASLRLSW